jgi:hypothetical protein
MFLKSKIYRAALACFLVLSMFSLGFADTIRLKDGSIIKGKIVSFGEGKFTIVIGDGTRQRQMNFFADEIDSIEFEASTLQPSNNNKTALPIFKNTSSQTDTKPTPQPTPTPSKSVIITDKTTQPTTQTTSNQSTTNPGTTNNSTSVPATTNPAVNNPTSTNPTTPNTPVKTETNSTTKAIMLNVKVLADNTANGWSNSGWVVKKGQRIRVSAKGQVSLGNGRFASAAGISSLPDTDKLIKAEATGGLIAVVGDDNNEFIFIGAAREFVAARDGALFMGINEGNLNDNSGAFDVTIEILP